MTQTKVNANVGVVGLGRMGQRHALNILHLVPRARLFAVCTPAPHEIEWAKKHLQPDGVLIFEDFESMIHTAGLNTVVIASPTELHIKHTLAALELGIHVLCEKPATTDLLLMRELILRADKYLDIKVMVGYALRFDENYQGAFRKIKEGAISDPIIVRSQGAEKLDETGHFIEYAQQSGGIFIDTVIHDIDLTLSFLGEDTQPKAL